LIDSGCELSLAPSSVVGDRLLRPVSQGVFAANGSPIFVQGETEIEMDLGGYTSTATVLLSPDVSELMLGITWLTREGVVWDFSARTLLVGRRSFALHSKKSSGICRRVYVDHDVVLSPRQQADVPVRSTLRSVRVSEGENWLLESRQLRPGVHLARTLLPDKHRDISVRVVNTTSEPQVIRHDLCVGNLEHVEVHKDARAAAVNTSDPAVSVTSSATVDPVSEMLRSLPPELEDEQRKAVADLLYKYNDVFSKGEFDVGSTHLITHHIDTGQNRPIRQPLRRHPTAYFQAIDDYVEQLLENDISEPSAGPWSSNIVVVRRKDGRLRLCVDYRAVNARTYHDSYPLPNIEATFDALSGSSWYCTLIFELDITMYLLPWRTGIRPSLLHVEVPGDGN